MRFIINVNCLKLQILLCILGLRACICPAQLTVHGIVRDMETGKPLSYTNIQIEGTYQGTITNDDGNYTLKIRKLPATLIYRFIGYESQRVSITENSPAEQNVLLKPTVIELPTIVVTSDDPAVGIMSRVIENKKKWRSQLKSYKAEAYTRVGLENDTSIVSIAESTSDIHWHHDKGIREVVRSRRETSNITSDMNFAFAGTVPNLYDDDISFDHQFIGPTHPKAHKYYRFKLIGERSLDDKAIVDIEITPKNKLQPTFVGRLSVILEEYAMIEIDVKTHEGLDFPPPIEELHYHFKQQYSNFGKEFWLPVDCRIGATVKIGLPGLQFPNITFNQVSRLTDYEVNVQLPDSLYEKKTVFQVDSMAIKQDTLLADETQRIPMTQRESEAYANIDSTMSLQKAFRPTGFLARIINARIDVQEREEQRQVSGNSKKWLSGIGPSFRFNRVDGFHWGLKYERDINKHVTFGFHGAYKTGLKRWAYGGSLKSRFGKKRKLFFNLAYTNDTQMHVPSRNYLPLFSTVRSVFGLSDYFNYHWNKSVRSEAELSFSRLPVRISLGLNYEEHTSVEKTTDWSLVNKERVQRPNPMVDEGKLRSIEARIVLGDEFIPWGPTGQNRLEIRAEHSSPDFFNSDFSFTRYELIWSGHITTFLSRRLLPNCLDFQVVAGAADGRLPVQRFYGMDVHWGVLTPFGAFKTLSQRPIGDRYVGIFWEHHFRTVPFEILGLEWLAKRGVGILIHGASGKTWFSEEIHGSQLYDFHSLDEWHHEIGFSLNGVFNFFRLDVTKRLRKPDWFIGLSIARLF